MPASITRNRTNHDFSRNPRIHLPRSVFSRPYKRLMTLNCSYLYPICCKLVNPAETWKMNLELMARLTTQIVPVMDNLKIQTFFFFDPCRLLWKNFSKLHGEKDNPDDNNSYLVPQIDLSKQNNLHGLLYDYMRAPLDVNKKVSALPFRMYNHVYNSYFRNQDIQDSLYFSVEDADDDYDKYELVRINKRADYITTGLKAPQAGEPVQLPLGTSAPVIGNGGTVGFYTQANPNNITNIAKTTQTITSYTYLDGTNVPVNTSVQKLNDTTGVTLNQPFKLSRDPETSGLIADLSDATAATVQSLRQLIATQELLERDNRNGVRYTEILEGRYGVTNPDLLLYRPQYLGGTTQYMGTTPVIQTSATNTVSPQGNLSGYAVGGDSGQVINASFGEWGYIMGLVCITAEPQYQYGCDRMYTMKDRFDFYYPEFNYIGDEALTNGQVFCQGDDVVDNEGNIIDNQPFNYTERNAYYKQNLNEICGQLRSDSKDSEGNSNTLQYWHYAEEWNEKQNFNSDFIKDKTYETIQRTLAIQDTETDDDRTEQEKLQDNAQVIMELDFYPKVYSPIPEYNVPRISSFL